MAERVGTEVDVRDSSENGISRVPPASLSGECNPFEGDDVLGREYSFDDDVFVGSEKDKGPRKTRSEKRERRHKHAKAKRACDGVLNLNLTMEELRKLQEEDPLIQDLRKSRPDKVVEQDGLWYSLWVRKHHPGHMVEQLLLPKQYHQIVCKLAHSVPIAGHLGQEKTLSRVTCRFYWPTVYRHVAEYCRRCPECQRTASLEYTITCSLSFSMLVLSFPFLVAGKLISIY